MFTLDVHKISEAFCQMGLLGHGLVAMLAVPSQEHRQIAIKVSLKYYFLRPIIYYDVGKKLSIFVGLTFY